MTFVTRFAPSPTGFLHLGHAFSALTAARAAEQAGGRFILRIEDIDAGRCRPNYEEAIFEDLAFLGIRWEEPVRRQSDHMADYQKALQGLIEKGLVYRCFKTRSAIMDEIARAPHRAPEGPDGPAYIGAPLPASEERALFADGVPFAWRLSMDTALSFVRARGAELLIREQMKEGVALGPADPRRFGDVVLGRKDNATSYHLASVHDDAHQGITHVIRGEDLREAAHIHVLLQAILGLRPVIYHHHDLITDETGRRLAKRDKDETISAMRARGVTRADILTRLGF